MIPPTESLRFVAGELGKSGRNLEQIGAQFWVPIASEFFLKTWRNAYLHVHDLGHIGKLEANLDLFKTPLSRGDGSGCQPLSLFSCRTRVRYSLKWLPRDLDITVRSRDCYRGAVRVSTGALDRRHYVCGAQAAGNWAEGRSVSLHMLYRSPEGVRHRLPHPPVAGTHSYRSTTEDHSSQPTIPPWDESLCAT